MIRVNLNTRGFQKLAARARGQAAVEIRRAVNEIAVEVVAAARTLWPVDTGRSRDGLAVYRAKIRNPVPYVPYIHFAGSARNVWRALIVEPSRRRLQAALPRLKRRYARALRGR